MSFHFSNSLLITLFLFPYAVMANEPSPHIWNITDQDRQFIGRQDELKNLNEMLSENNIVAIVGLAGIGKTNFAKQFAILNRQNYTVFWFIDCRRDIETQLYELAKELSDKRLIQESFSPHDITEGAKSALKWLKSTEDSWLMIFDNVDGKKDVHAFIPEANGHPKKHVLVTERNSSNWTKTLPLPAFSDIESLSFLKTALASRFKEDELVELATTLGRHPRALLQATLHIARVPGMTCKKYVEKYMSNNRKLTKAEKMILTDEEAGVELHTSLEILLDNISKTSFMSWSHIEEELLDKCQEMLGYDGELTYINLIKPALLVKEGKGYAIHPYVATMMHNYISEEEKQKALEDALKILASDLDKNTDKMIKIFEEKSNFLNHIIDLTKHYNGTSQLATDLEVAALYYIFNYQRRYDLAWSLVEQSKNRIERRGDVGATLAVGRFYSIYSFLVYKQGSLGGAVEAALKAESILDKLDDDIAREELIILLTNSLASHYHAQGEASKALNCANKATILLGKEHSLKKELFIAVTKILSAIDDRDFDAARKYTKEQFVNLEDNEIAHISSHIVNLLAAKIEIKESNMKLARKYAEKGYQQALNCIGNDEKHETAGRVGTILALCELYDGSLARAERLVDNAIEGFTKTYGSPYKNRRQAYAHMVKGDVLVKKEDLTAAHASYSKSLEIYNNEFTNMKVDDVSELYFRFINLGLLLDEKLLTEDYLDKHIRIFGKLHPRSVAAMQAIKKAGEAVALKEK
jgi:predicted negative regulator of RcsB-dependent stress response